MDLFHDFLENVGVQRSIRQAGEERIVFISHRKEVLIVAASSSATLVSSHPNAAQGDPQFVASILEGLLDQLHGIIQVILLQANGQIHCPDLLDLLVGQGKLLSRTGNYRLSHRIVLIACQRIGIVNLRDIFFGKIVQPLSFTQRNTTQHHQRQHQRNQSLHLFSSFFMIICLWQIITQKKTHLSFDKCVRPLTNLSQRSLF